MKNDDFIRNCKCVRVVDGDTVDVEIDLGFQLFTVQRIRLADINAPERGDKKAWIASKAALINMIESWPLKIQTRKTGKFGRWIGTLYMPAGTSVNQWMLDNGHAKPYTG